MVRRQPNPRSKFWCFTLNNPTHPADKDTLLHATTGGTPGGWIDYIVFQYEEGESGTPHYQGYLETRRIRRGTIKTYLGMPTIHLETRKGSQEAAIRYCKKDERRNGDSGPWEAGHKFVDRREGHRDSIQKVLDGTPMRDIALSDPQGYVKHGSGWKSLRAQVSEHRNGLKPKIVIFYGKTGTGKSYTASKIWPNAYDVPWPVGGHWWWPEYDGERTVILGEFRHQIKMGQMLKLLDRYAFHLEEKHHSMKLARTTRRFVFTTNIPPHKWYPKCRDVSMLRRRLNQFATIWKFKKIRRWYETDEDPEPVPLIRNKLVALKPREVYNFNIFNREQSPDS